VAYVGTFMTGFLHGGFLVSQYCWLYLGMGFGLAKVGGAETDQANRSIAKKKAQKYPTGVAEIGDLG
jgi:hypothetical protein